MMNTSDLFDQYLNDTQTDQMEKENHFADLAGSHTAAATRGQRNSLYNNFNFNLMNSLNDSTQSSLDMSSTSTNDLYSRRRSTGGAFQAQSQLHHFSTPIKQQEKHTHVEVSPINQAYLNLLARQNRSNSIASPFANFESMQQAANTITALNLQKQQQQQHQQNKNRRMSMFNTPSPYAQQYTPQQQSNIWDRIRHKNLSTNANRSLFMEREAPTPNLIRPLFDIGERQLTSFEEKVASTGNIFVRREDWGVLKELPVDKQNSIHVRLEDEGPYGNDETRCFVLSHFSSLGLKDIECVLCASLLAHPQEALSIFDRFPLVNGTLFLSPIRYNAKLLKYIKANVAGKEQYIYAACLKCLNHWDSNIDENNNKSDVAQTNEKRIKCKHCATKWKSESIQIGTLYKYDLLAAYPCCNARLTCNKCKTQLCDLDTNPLPYFSSYSEEIECFNCKSKDYHFIKQIEDIFTW